jgi:hypothetical protein
MILHGMTFGKLYNLVWLHGLDKKAGVLNLIYSLIWVIILMPFASQK